MKNDYTLTNFLNGKVRFYQKSDGFRFGTDSFLLADFASLKGSEIFADLGTGCGVIAILLLKKYPKAKGIGIDIVKENSKIAVKNAKLNGVSERFLSINANVREIFSFLKPERVEVVVMNPPFIEVDKGKISKVPERAIARQEITATLEDFIKASRYLLKNKGRLFVLLPLQRFVDFVVLSRSYSIEPKRLRFVYPSFGKNANLFLAEAVKNGGKGLTVEPPLVVYQDPYKKIYTEEVALKYERFLQDD